MAAREDRKRVSPSPEHEREVPRPFRFMTETWTVMWTGYVADDLPSLLQGIRQVPSSSIYYHVHHAVFRRPKYAWADYTNDFARWVFAALGQKGMAEKLSSVDPLEFFTVGQCRARLAACVEEYVNEGEVFSRVPRGREFYFLQTRSFVIPTGLEAANLKDFVERVADLSLSSVLYHFVEARFREGEETDDFSRWLALHGEHRKAKALQRLNPYMYDLEALKTQIVNVLRS
jgi:hypothetical protein